MFPLVSLCQTKFELNFCQERPYLFKRLPINQLFAGKSNFAGMNFFHLCPSTSPDLE